MKIQILGTGCAKCELLAEQTERAVRELGLDTKVEKVTDINEIIGFGVMMTPALVIDGAVRVVGKVPPLEEIKKMIS